MGILIMPAVPGVKLKVPSEVYEVVLMLDSKEFFDHANVKVVVVEEEEVFDLFFSGAPQFEGFRFEIHIRRDKGKFSVYYVRAFLGSDMFSVYHIPLTFEAIRKAFAQAAVGLLENALEKARQLLRAWS